MKFKISYFKKEIKWQYKLIISILQFIEYMIVIPFLLISIIVEAIFKIIETLAKVRFIYSNLNQIRIHQWFLSWRFINMLDKKNISLTKK